MSITDYCECDNTHENNKTVCQYCWEKGIRYTEKETLKKEFDGTLSWFSEFLIDIAIFIALLSLCLVHGAMDESLSLITGKQVIFLSFLIIHTIRFAFKNQQGGKV